MEIKKNTMIIGLGNCGCKITKLFADIKKKYFKGKTTEEVLNVLEQALASWFSREGDVDV